LLREHGIAIRFTDDERRDLAHHAGFLSAFRLASALLIVASSTMRGWQKRIAAAAKAAAAAVTKRQRRTGPGRPPLKRSLRRRVIRCAWDNPTFGYDKISQHLAAIGITISPTSVGTILAAAGVPPAPRRTDQRKRWKHFLAAHWSTLASCDFTTVPVITLAGIKLVQVLVVMRLSTREVHLATATQNPDVVLMRQVARNLTMEDGFLQRHGITHLIRDRSITFGQSFDDVLTDAGITPVITPVEAPNANAHIERWFGSCRRECLDRVAFFGDTALRHVMCEYIDYHNHHRPHSALSGRPPIPSPHFGTAEGPVKRRTKLGGLLAWYERRAA
jgi:transposase InsO family protein